MTLYLYFLCLATILNCILHPDTHPNVVNLLDRISFSMTGVTSAYGILWFNWKRDSITKLLLIVNAKSLAILKSENGGRYRRQRNMIQFFSICLFITLQTVAIIVHLSFIAQFFIYDRVLFHVFYDSSRLSVNLQFMGQLMNILWIILHFPSYFTLTVEIF